MVIFSHRYLDNDCINFKTFVFLAPSKHYHTTQTSKFNFFFLNGASTMLNNVFNWKSWIFVSAQLHIRMGMGTGPPTFFKAETKDAKMKRWGNCTLILYKTNGQRTVHPPCMQSRELHPMMSVLWVEPMLFVLFLCRFIKPAKSQMITSKVHSYRRAHFIGEGMRTLHSLSRC